VRGPPERRAKRRFAALSREVCGSGPANRARARRAALTVAISRLPSLSIGQPRGDGKPRVREPLGFRGGLRLKPPYNLIASVAVSDRESGFRSQDGARKIAAIGNGCGFAQEICAPLYALGPEKHNPAA
jgi:hypothetical protein